MFGIWKKLKAAQAENLKLKTVNLKLREQCDRLRFPTGLKMPADATVEAMLARPGRGCVEGIEALLLQHVWEQSGQAFDPENLGETRAYYVGGAAALEQFRVELKERMGAQERP